MNELRVFLVSKQHHKYRVNTDYASAWDFFCLLIRILICMSVSSRATTVKVLCSAANKKRPTAERLSGGTKHI